MDTNKMREQFEAWAVTSAWLGLGQESEIARDGEGYAETEVHTAWLAWKGSRDWLVVELPDSVANTGTLASAAVLSYKRECREAIESQGLKVAP